MATIEPGEHGAANKTSTSKKNKRKHKAKSLVVSTKCDTDGDLNTNSNLSLSAECDSSKFGLRKKFSFRSLGRGRNTSKSSLTSNLNVNNACKTTETASNPTSPSELYLKCPVITFNDSDTQSSPPIESKCARASSLSFALALLISFVH